MPSNTHRSQDHAPAVHKTGVMKLMSAVTHHHTSLNSQNLMNIGKIPIIDQVLPSEDFLTCQRTGQVKLRFQDKGMAAEQPISIPTLIQDTSYANPDVTALKFKNCSSEDWSTLTYTQLYDQIKAVARAFIELGLPKQHSVGIIGNSSCHQSLICHLAAFMSGCISSCINASLSLEDTAKACVESKSDIIIVQHLCQLKNILAIQHRLPQLKVIVLLHGEPSVSDKRRLQRSCQKEILTWAALSDFGQKLSDKKLSERLCKVNVNQCAVICYNSDGCGMMYSHDNITWTANMVAQGLIRPAGFKKPASPGEEIVLHCGPMTDIATQIVEIFYPLSVAANIIIPSSDAVYNYDKIFNIMREIQPTLIWGTSKLYEQIYHKLRNMHYSMSKIKKTILDWYSSGTNHNKITKVPQKFAMKTLINQYRTSVGLQSKTVLLCRDGHHLHPLVHHYLANCGITVYSSFGSAELCGFVLANIPKRFCKLGTVGKQLPGVSLKSEQIKSDTVIEDQDTQEVNISARSRGIFMGFINRESENDMLGNNRDEGWIKLEHSATVDNEGYFVVHDEEQTKNSKIETRIRLELGCISQCIAVDLEDGKKGVILSLDCVYDKDGGPSEQLSPTAVDWFKSASWDILTMGDLMDNIKQEKGIKHCIQAGIDRANQSAISPDEWVDQWEIKTTCLSYQSGELITGTTAIKRKLIITRYQSQICQIFSNKPQDIGSSLAKSDNLFAFPCHLSQILEEEERQSSRNSVEKESDTVAVIKEEAKSEDNKEIVVMEKISENDKCDDEVPKNVIDYEAAREDNIENEEVDENENQHSSDKKSSEEKISNKKKISRT